MASVNLKTLIVNFRFHFKDLKMKQLITSLNNKAQHVSRRISAALIAPSRATSSMMLFGAGVVLLTVGMDQLAIGQGHKTTYNDVRFSDSLNAILVYIEGTFGAMVMVSAGIGAILSSAFGQYRAALGLLVVAVGAFILRSLVGTFFNDSSIRA